MRAVLLLLAVLHTAWAPFPAVCNTPESINSKRCCPNDCGLYGTCVNVVQEVENSWAAADPTIVEIVHYVRPLDVRYEWPTRVFDWVCSCDEGWGGYDCSKCDFAYIDDGNGGCVKRTSDQLLVRRNFMDLTHQQQLDYIRVLKAAKNEAEDDREWAVAVSEPNDLRGNFVLQNVSSYDMLVVPHFLAGRDKDNNKCKDLICPIEIDFAHEGPCFLTWHRYYLMILESALHKVAERIGVNDFGLVYWDWTPGDTNLFSHELFGTPEYSNTPVEVEGGLFEDWPVIYDAHYKAYLAQNGFGGVEPPCAAVRALRDIEQDRAENNRLERGRVCDDFQFLPDDGSIEMALTATTYAGTDGINNRLEGFRELCADEDPPCIAGGGNNNLHNAVHIYLSGHMRDVPTASNDPIFFLHHTNVDRQFEAWLRKYNGNLPDYLPITGGHPGHNRDDYLVPFLPLRTNADMYKISSELGFQYDSLPWNVNSSVPDVDMCDPGVVTCDKGGYIPNAPPPPDTCPDPYVCPRTRSTKGRFPWCGKRRHLLPYCKRRRHWIRWCKNRKRLPWCRRG